MVSRTERGSRLCGNAAPGGTEEGMSRETAPPGLLREAGMVSTPGPTGQAAACKRREHPALSCAQYPAREHRKVCQISVVKCGSGEGGT